ncbi:MAG TPA: thiamine pyrophosphate-dependent enzyme, partial [Acidimicrobiia bacterium]|nr:thiamine pyrophosphate-dependent enzyme [Acidimicrobiia bacterium]
MSSMTGGRAFARQLAREGVRHVFGLPGDQIMYALDGLYDEPGIQFVTTRHEQGTTFMADGYARSSGRPGVAFVVPGVGVYNAGAGLATAWASSSPVLLVAGQVNRHGIGASLGLLHEVHDQLDLVRPVTAWQERALTAEAIPAAVHGAFERLRRGRRRPVEIEMPPEAFAETADVELLEPARDVRVAADPDAIAPAAEALAAADRPLVWAGGGVVLGNASEELTAVAEFLQAPVITTRQGKGAIDDRNPLSVGTAWVNKRVQPVVDDADVILAVGSHFGASGATKEQVVVHLDVDPAEIGRHFADAVPVVGDAAPTLAALLDELETRTSPRPSRATETRAMRARAEEELRAVGPQAAMVDVLRSAVPDDGILVPCTTTVGYMCHMYYRVYEPRTYLSTSYMGTLGFGFPAALGAKVACPDRPVVCVTGDGGFLFAATELATAVQYGINVVTVVYNDNAYGNSNRDQRERFGGREIGTVLRNPDFAKFAESFGADGAVVKDASELGPVLREALADERP